jgi:hypothetical protein
MEHRWGRRYDTDVSVRFVALPGTIGSGRVTNVSLSGAFMETTAKLRLRTVLYIEGLESARERGKAGTSKRLAATVVRRCSAGVGLEWCERAYPVSELSQFSTSAGRPPARQGQTMSAPAEPGSEPYVYRLDFID